MSGLRQRLSQALTWYLNDPLSLAVSAAFTCGLLAFFIGTLFASLMAGKAVSACVGAVLAVGGGYWAARDQLRGRKVRGDSKSCCVEKTATRWFSLFAGSGMISVAALQVLGLSGNWLLLIALVTGALISTMFVLVLDPQ